jgi:sugar/nucleoside kinase (ribokinase family)
LYCRVQLVGVVGSDFPMAQLGFLSARGVDLSGLEQETGESFRWAGTYSYDLNSRETRETRLGVFANFKPKIPDHFRDAKWIFLGNIDPVLQLQVLEQVRSPRVVACDTMNFWIEGKRDSVLQMLKGVDVLLINDQEARDLALDANTVRAAKKILGFGPTSLIIKRGEYGAALYNNHSHFAVPAYPLLDPVDPTGAGDSFAGGFMGHLARRGTLDEATIRQALVVGSVMASFCVEDFSLRRFQSLRPEQIRTRLKEFGRMTQYADPT